MYAYKGENMSSFASSICNAARQVDLALMSMGGVGYCGQLITGHNPAKYFDPLLRTVLGAGIQDLLNNR